MAPGQTAGRCGITEGAGTDVRQRRGSHARTERTLLTHRLLERRGLRIAWFEPIRIEAPPTRACQFTALAVDRAAQSPTVATTRYTAGSLLAAE